jgi:hypothetical protein
MLRGGLALDERDLLRVREICAAERENLVPRSTA